MPLRRADDILAWLLSRQPDKRILEKTTGLPYGWGLWLRALKPVPYSVRATEMVAQLMQRPLPGSPGRLPALSFPQALRRLAWQTWDPAPRDQRWMRWTSAAISVLLHVMFALLLVWVAVIRPPVEPEQGGDGGRMRVDFIGQGTPAEDGGGGQPGDAEAAQPSNAGAAQPNAAVAARPANAVSARANVERGSAPLNEASQPQPADTPPTASRAEPGSTTASEPSPPTPVPAEVVPPTPVAAAPPPEPQATPPTPVPVVEQPIQATDVAEATTDFVVPPTTVPRTEVRVVPRDVPTVTVRERTVTTVEAPQVTPTTPQLRPIEPQLRPREITVREREVTVVTAPTPAVPVPMPRVEVTLPQRDVQVREREVTSVPVVDVTIPQLPSREVTVRPPTRSPEVAVRERTVPNAPPRPVQAATPAPSATPTPPTPASSTTPASASSTTPTPAVVERGSAPLSSAPSPSASRAEPGSTSTSPAASSQSPARSAASATPSPSATPAARPAPNPGDWSTPARGDDWGAASRNAPGSTAQANQGTGRTGDGLFNADGSVRVPNQDGSGNSERGAPGGANDGWSRERIAQSGTWLKRPPYDYTPTSFDKYWAPNESLLAEWVRRGIQTMEIPIPGTNSKISCVISVLQFGGGCGLTDPNMQDQPAVARPPPDVPFKKEFQEDNGSR
ncbi:hypothetical protein [Stenotrophomonas sp. 278]|uniref:hypothetical protein n=1 Tax=Stenotrophomonas sp. 278 TaxID=2479851 RepID=UPI000F6601DF|nr:hypothetical protein [Stenotrophomonas sp. 278]RRU21486.1 hypothetical protein EGJ34_04345 [Stenotrophomonas sp. 278]